MAAAAGSSLFRRLLGQQLLRARKEAGITQEQVAQRLSRRTTAVSRYEIGEALIHRLSLEVLCDFYELGKDATDYLMQLHSAAQAQPWWSHLGPQSELTSSMLMLEKHAHRLREYDANFIPGLLQMPAYARAVNEAVDVDTAPEQTEMGVRLRMERQTQFWQSGRIVAATFLIDETVLVRMPGSTEARRAQLNRLLDPPRPATVQIIPFSSGPHPSMATYTVFDLDLGGTASAKGVYVEGAAAQQGVIAETEREVTRYELVFERTRAKALSPETSVLRIQEIIRSIRDD